MTPKSRSDTNPEPRESEPREWALRREGDPETPTTTSPTSPPPDPITDQTPSAGSPEQLPTDMREQLTRQRDQHNDPVGIQAQARNQR